MDRSLEVHMARYNMTGGYDLVSIERSTPRLVEFVVRERKTGLQAFGTTELTGDTPPRVRQGNMVRVPPGATRATP